MSKPLKTRIYSDGVALTMEATVADGIIKEVQSLEHKVRNALLTCPLKPESDTHEPTLFEEVFDAVKSSLLVYGTHDARKLAREGKLCMQDDPSLIEKMVQLPITEREGIELLKVNQKTIKESGWRPTPQEREHGHFSRCIR
jgi:hypothetical protein